MKLGVGTIRLCNNGRRLGRDCGSTTEKMVAKEATAGKEAEKKDGVAMTVTERMGNDNGGRGGRGSGGMGVDEGRHHSRSLRGVISMIVVVVAAALLFLCSETSVTMSACGTTTEKDGKQVSSLPVPLAQPGLSSPALLLLYTFH